MSLPVAVILGLLLGHAAEHPKPAHKPSSGQALAPLTPSAPPPAAATEGPCTKLLTALPVQLGNLVPRIVHPRPDSAFVVAWGDPAVVLRCGVERPSALRPASSDLDIGVDGVFWLPVKRQSGTVWTTVDRAAYIEVAVPSSYPQPPLGLLADAIAKVLPAVCVPQAAPGEPPTNPKTLCTNR